MWSWHGDVAANDSGESDSGAVGKTSCNHDREHANANENVDRNRCRHGVASLRIVCSDAIQNNCSVNQRGQRFSNAQENGFFWMSCVFVIETSGPDHILTHSSGS